MITSPHTKEQFEAILASVADGITVQDTKGRLVYVNEAAAEIMGFKNPKEVLSTDTSKILSRFEIMDERQEAMSLSELPGRKAISGEPETSRVIGFKTVGSIDVRWSVVRARPIKGPGGKVEFAVNVFQDITELKNAQLRLLDANERITKLLERALDS